LRTAIQAGERGLKRGSGILLAAGQALEQDQPEGVHVSGCCNLVTSHLFGGQVGGGTDQQAALGDPGRRDHSGDAEVSQPHPRAGTKQHVVGFHVAVHDIAGVDVGQGVGDRRSDLRRPHQRQPLAARLPQGWSLDQRHHQVLVTVLGPGVEQLDQVGVPQVGQRANLGTATIGAADAGPAKDLDRDPVTAARIDRGVHVGHAAAPQQATQRIAADEQGVAYVAAEPFSDRCFNLHFLAVEPERHGRGIGSRLVAEVEQRLVSLGPGLARVLLIETSSTPQYEATRAFYSARGYTHEATVRDFYGPSDHKIVFWKLGCQHFSGQVALLGP